MPTPRQSRKLETRALLIDVATRQIEEHGFEATTIRGIAREAGVATGTVFVHFENKTDLLHCAFHDDIQRIADGATASLPGSSIEADLHHVVAHFYDAFAKRPELYRTLLKESLFEVGEWGARFTEQVQRVANVVAQLFEGAKDRGELAADLDLVVATTAFFSFYYFLLMDAAKNDFIGIDERLGRFDRMLAQHLKGFRP